MVAFSPRAQNITLYIMPGFWDYKKALKKLGKAKSVKSYLYINKLAGIDEKICARSSSTP